jgi:hypothetical protein
VTPYDTIHRIASRWSQAERTKHLSAVACFMENLVAAETAPAQTTVTVEVVVYQGGVRSAKQRTETSV